MKRTPNEEQLQALRQFKEFHGRYWKHALHKKWLNGTCSPLLQQVRNEFGPAWLKTWRDK